MNAQGMLEKLGNAIKDSQNLLNSYPNHLPFKILMDQLYFMRDYFEGKTNDQHKLKAVNLSYIIAREVDDINPELADSLSEIYINIRQLRGENIYKL